MPPQVRPALALPTLLAALAACADEPTGGGGTPGGGERPVLVVERQRVALVPGGSAIEVPIVVRGAGGIEGVSMVVGSTTSGVTATLVPGASDTAATVRITADASALHTGAQFHARATVPGQLVSDVVFVVPIVVAEAQRVTFAWCPSTSPAFVAARDAAEGPWTRLVPDPDGRVRFGLPSGRGALAWVRTDGAAEAAASYVRTRVVHATPAELRALSGRESGACAPDWSEMTGEVRGLAWGDEAQLALGTGWDVVFDAAAPGFTLQVEGTAPQSLYAVRSRWRPDPWRSMADGVVLRRGVPIVEGGTVAPVDFAAAEAFVPTIGGVTVDGLLGDTAYVYGSFRNATQVVTLSSHEEVAEGTRAEVGMLMPSRLAADERQAVIAASFRANTDSDVRGVVRWYRDFLPATVTMGPRVALPAPSGGRLTLPVQAEYAGAAWATFAQHDETRLREVVVELTAGYRGSGTSWELSPPALGAASGAQGWWGLEPRAVTVGWGATSEDAWWLWTLPPAGMTGRSASAERQFAWDGTGWGASGPALRATAARGSRGKVPPVGPGLSALQGRRP